jgi:hypothetical protein
VEFSLNVDQPKGQPFAERLVGASRLCPWDADKNRIPKRSAVIRTQGQVGYRRRDVSGETLPTFFETPLPVGTHGCASLQKAVFNREKYNHQPVMLGILEVLYGVADSPPSTVPSAPQTPKSLIPEFF